MQLMRPAGVVQTKLATYRAGLRLTTIVPALLPPILYPLLVPACTLQETEALQARLEAREKELEAAQERAEAAEHAVSEREQELAGRRDASAEEVRWAPTRFCAAVMTLQVHAVLAVDARCESWSCAHPGPPSPTASCRDPAVQTLDLQLFWSLDIACRPARLAGSWRPLAPRCRTSSSSRRPSVHA